MSEQKEVKYSASLIVRNCAESLDRCLTSLDGKPDEIVVVNTAATIDEPGFMETNAVALKHGAKVFHFPWIHDFAEARNYAQSKCSNDVVFWIDSDDVLENAELFDQNVRRVFGDGNIDAIFMEYPYEFDKNGNCTTLLNRERVVDRRCYEWQAPIHEVQCATLNVNTTVMPADVSRVVHCRQAEDEQIKRNSLRRNLRVFIEQFEKTGKDPGLRMLFYWGNTLFGLCDIEGSAAKYEEYWRRCKVEGNKNYGEMYVVACSLSEAYRELKKYDLASKYASEAIMLNPRTPSGYLHMAKIAMMTGDVDRGLAFALEAEKRAPNMTEEMVTCPKAVMGLPAFIAARAFGDKGHFKMALQYLEKARKWYGDQEEFQIIEAICQRQLAMGAQRESFARVRDALLAEKKFAAAYNLCLNAPSHLQDSPEVGRYLPKKRPADKPSIAFICPDSGINFVWGPWSVKDGVGGSEEAVINASREFSKRGWHVEVYCNTGKARRESPVVEDGVEWWPISCWTGKQDKPLDVAIWWRAPMLPTVLGTAAKKNYLWLHDIFVGGSWKRNTHELYDGVILLSKYHRKLYEKVVPEEKVIYSENGLDPSLFVPEAELVNDPHKMIWGSDPSRGLQHLLPWWEKIRAAVPDATLDIYYGWTPHFMAAAKVSKWHADVYRQIEDLKNQPGITWHGKVGHAELAKAYAACGVWPYMTNFPEIHCISALKAQAHGACPVTVDDFALSETVQYGDKVKGPLDDAARQAEYVDRLIWRLKNPLSAEKRKEMIRWSRSRSWASVVAAWEQAFQREVPSSDSPSTSPEVSDSPLPSPALAST